MKRLKESNKYEFPLRKYVGLYSIVSNLGHIILRNLANVSPNKEEERRSKLTTKNFIGYLGDVRGVLEAFQINPMKGFDYETIERLDQAKYLQRYLKGFSEVEIIEETKRLENLIKSMREGSANKKELAMFYNFVEEFRKVIPTENPEDFHSNHKL